MPWIKAVFMIFWRWMIKLLIWMLLILLVFGANASSLQLGVSLALYDLLCLALLIKLYKPDRWGPSILILVDIVFSIGLAIFIAIG